MKCRIIVEYLGDVAEPGWYWSVDGGERVGPCATDSDAFKAARLWLRGRK